MRLAFFCLFAAIATDFALGQTDDPRFNQWLERSRAVFDKNHLIAYVSLEQVEGNRQAEYRYDRYPEVERIQEKSGETFARKKGKQWIKSDDWGKTGHPIKAAKRQELDGLVQYVGVPIANQEHEARDKSQGGIVTRLVHQSKTDDGDEEFVFEQGREKQSGVNYPTYTFLKYKNSPPDDATLYKFSGPFYVGSSRMMVNIQYGVMIFVNATWVTPTPTPETSPAQSASPNPSAH